MDSLIIAIFAATALWTTLVYFFVWHVAKRTGRLEEAERWKSLVMSTESLCRETLTLALSKPKSDPVWSLVSLANATLKIAITTVQGLPR